MEDATVMTFECIASPLCCAFFYTRLVATVDTCCHNTTALYAQEPSRKFYYVWEREKNIGSIISHRMKVGGGGERE